MDHVKMKISEGKGGTSYSFSYAYTNREQEIKWVENVIVAKRVGDKWTFAYNAAKDQTQEQFDTYKKTLEKVTQIVDTNAMNLNGVKVEHEK